MKFLGAVGLSAILGTAFLLAPAPNTPAEACQYSDVSCRDKIGEALRDLNPLVEDNTDAAENSLTVGGAVRDCIRCAYEEFKNGLDSIRVDGNYSDDDDE